MAKVINELRLIKKQSKQFKKLFSSVASINHDPYRILVSCILSLRTKDALTAVVAPRLFKIAPTPKKMIRLNPRKLSKIIYPVGFYRNKSKTILDITKSILQEYNGKVPDNLRDLLRLNGVGQKTANLVLSVGYRKPAICVDTHVHRVSNRLGWVNTKNPKQTEEELKKVFIRRYWSALNSTLVTFGQNICTPISPYCTKCFVNRSCPHKGVKKSR